MKMRKFSSIQSTIMPRLRIELSESLLAAPARAMPAYTAAQAARYLDIPQTTVRAWFFGTSHSRGRFEAILRPADEVNKLLSFENLAEAYVYRSMRKVSGLSPEKIRIALSEVARRFKCERPLLQQRFMTDGAEVFIESAFDDPSCVTTNQLFFEWYIDSLKRVEWEDSVFARFYPVTWKCSGPSDPVLHSAPKRIVIDPEFAFGATVVASCMTPTRPIAERYFSGESIDELSEDFRCSTTDIEEAIRSECKFSRVQSAA